MKRTTSWLAVAALVVLPADVFADDSASALAALKDVVDPYVPGAERGRFLAAAGVDSELDAGEFKANAELAADKEPFVRKFDTWPAIVQFDKNNNKSIDWFEADGYRRALRDAVVKAHDKDRNGQLDDAEKLLAGKALAAGAVPRVVPEPGDARPLGPGEFPAGRSGDWDANGDGKLDQDELKAFSQAQKERYERWNAEYTKKWDADGDGKLSNEERAAASKAAMDEWKANNPDAAARYEKQQEEWKKQQAETLAKYDKDGSGRIDGDEWKAVQEDNNKAWKERDPKGYEQYQKQLDAWNKQQAEITKKYDVNGDGKLDGDEWKAYGEDQRAQWKKQQEEMLAKYDKNGNGRLDTDEWMEQQAENMKAWKARDPDAYARHEKQQEEWKKEQAELVKKYDANGDGQINGEEWQVVSADRQKQYVEKYDTDGDGKLNADENAAAWRAQQEEWKKKFPGGGGYPAAPAAGGFRQVIPGGQGG